MISHQEQERRYRLQTVDQIVQEKFDTAIESEPDSVEALAEIRASQIPLPDSVVKAATTALLLESASAAAHTITYKLLFDAIVLAEESSIPGKTVNIAEILRPDIRSDNPTLSRVPKYLGRVFTQSSRLALDSVLTEIEEGDRGLIGLTRLPERSINLLAPIQVPNPQGIIRVFPTSVPGLEFGFQFPEKANPNMFFFLKQFNAKGAQDNRLVPRSDLTL